MLSTISFFTGVDSELLALVEARAIRRRVAAGNTVFDEGDPANSMFVVLSGSVAVSKLQGDIAQPICDFTTGDFFGEMALATDEPRTATVTATADTELLEISRMLFTEIFGTDPELSARIGQAIVARTEANSRAEVAAHREAQQ